MEISVISEIILEIGLSRQSYDQNVDKTQMGHPQRRC